MSPVFAARRRAEEFDSLVEGTSTRELHDSRTVELAELVAALRATPPAEARPAFVADLRERLMAEAATALAPAPGAPARARDDVDRRLTVSPSRTRRDRRIAAAVGGVAIVGATTSMAVAAQSALPGDTLYPLKRAIENAQTGFNVSDGSKGSALLANAQGRLEEVEKLSRSEKAREDAGTAETIASTLATFTDQAGAASELLIEDYEENANAGAIAELRDFTGASMSALADLESLLPEGARPALIQAAQLLTQIDAEAAALCTVCGGEGISVIPPFAIQAVEDVLGGLVGALDPATGPSDDQGRGTSAGQGQGQGGKGKGGQGKAGPGGGQAVPTDVPTLPPVLGGDGQQPAPAPSDQPATLGDVIGGLLGGGGNGGNGGNGNGGGTTTSTPTTLPEVIGDVLGGVGDLVGSILDPLLPPKPTKSNPNP